MKCVCPMGGDRVCPDDCLLAVWATLPSAGRKAQRKTIAAKLYTQGFTMDQIATQLGVSHQTIGRDLEGLSTMDKPPRPKGGRPKGKRQVKRRTGPTPAVEQQLAEAVLDEGKTLEQATKELGLSSVQHAKLAVAKEEGRREAEPQITPDMLAMTAQQKLEAAVRQHQKKLDATFERRVLDEIKKRIDEMILPHWKKQIDEAQQLYSRRRGLMDKATFNAIRRALHPDSRNSISDKVLGAAFDTFMGLEKFLLNEKDSPTKVGDGLPSSWADWEAAKQRTTAERRAKRQGNRSAVRRA